MAEENACKRMVVMVDGAELRQTKDDPNQSSIQRLSEMVRQGVCPSGSDLVQITKHYTAAPSATKLSDKFRPTAATEANVDIIKTITKDICLTLDKAQDEIWLYGSGPGATVVRAVVGLVRRIGLLGQGQDGRFDERFDVACIQVKAEASGEHVKAYELQYQMDKDAGPSPRIRFLGLLDSPKTTSKMLHDASIIPNVEIVRHALAMNEHRSSKLPELFSSFQTPEFSRHSFIQAWFLGTTDDVCGAVPRDGLSLYPLQWLVIESMQAGLFFEAAQKIKVIGGTPLSLVFPQFAGNLPNLGDGREDVEWQILYSNHIQISMFDLQSSHALRANDVETHGIRFSESRLPQSAVRQPFSTEGLMGWCDEEPRGTIIHPSVFCILDRFPRYLEVTSLKRQRHGIANFQDRYLAAENTSFSPWLGDVQLEASGAKAFRILVCGKTGVGKSTLINKIFGVEMTEESNSYDQGVHDINVAFESPRHPGLLIHDSRGWQAGSDTELDLIAKFLRHRAFQQNPAEALHVIWFCVDADVSRIEEADKRTFATIAQFSHQVPVFVIGTKKDKLISQRQLQLLDELMEKSNDYKEAKKIAEERATESADKQFSKLRDQLSQIEHYKADGYCCLSKDDDEGVKNLLSQTLDLIVDERVRLFCVAAQVVDVEQKINSAITECMRLGTHAIRTAALPLPLSGIIGTPTVSRLICEHVLQCFGFPKTTPAEVEQIMNNIVLGNLKKFMTVSVSQLVAMSAITIGVAFPTGGIGIILGAAGCLWSLPPTARMLFKCSCDIILILERSFRYDGKYVSVKQIEDAARYYTTSTVKPFNGEEKRLQLRVHEEIEELVPLRNIAIGFKFNKQRSNIEDIIYRNRFERPPGYKSLEHTVSAPAGPLGPVEVSAGRPTSELPGDSVQRLSDTGISKSKTLPGTVAELDSTQVMKTDTNTASLAGDSNDCPSELASTAPTFTTTETTSSKDIVSELSANSPGTENSNSRAELEAGVPNRVKSGSRWSKLSWKIGSKKSKGN